MLFSLFAICSTFYAYKSVFTGRYECVSNTNKQSLPVIQWENINSIKQQPIIQTSKNKQLNCENPQSVRLQCCSNSDYEVEMVKVSGENGQLTGEFSLIKMKINKSESYLLFQRHF